MTAQGGSTVTDAFRPTTLDDVIGQEAVKDELRVAIEAATVRGDMPGPILFTGPAGTGKTTLSLIMATELHGRLVSLMGPSLRVPKNLINVVAQAHPRDVIFIDEIHRMYRPLQEWMYPIMEDGTVHDGDLTFSVPPITWVGATTDPERMLTPMLDRFTRILNLRPYTPAELALIVQRAAGKLGCALADDAALLLGANAHGVPRVALRMMLAARDYAYAGNVDSKIGGTWPRTTQVAIDNGDVQRVLASSAYEWRLTGRTASDR